MPALSLAQPRQSACDWCRHHMRVTADHTNLTASTLTRQDTELIINWAKVLAARSNAIGGSGILRLHPGPPLSRHSPAAHVQKGVHGARRGRSSQSGAPQPTATWTATEATDGAGATCWHASATSMM